MDEQGTLLDVKNRIIAKAIEDPEFRDRLKENPHAALAELGANIPQHHEIAILTDSPKKSHIVLPEFIEESPISDEDLEKVSAAGSTTATYCNCNDWDW